MSDQRASSFIYLIEAENGFVKIGRGQNVADRLQATRVHSPVLTRLVAVWPGVRVDEEALHERFRDFRHHGEWFETKGELAEFIERSRGLGLSEVSPWAELKFANRGEHKIKRASVLRNHSGVERRSNRPRVARGTVAGLTGRQSAFLSFIKRHIAEKGFSPSFQELADEFGLASKSNVHRVIHSLIERGHLEIEPNLARSICLAKRDDARTTGRSAPSQNTQAEGTHA